MAAESKGLKRICMSCGTRFYDLNRDPILCPSCGTEFTGEIKVKSRRGRIAADIEEEDAPIIEADDTVEVAAEGDAETVSLEEVEEDAEELDDDALPIEADIEDLDDDMDEDIAEDEEDEDDAK